MSTMNCEHCGSTSADTHSFHYGKRGTSEMHPEVAGTDTVALCAQCLARARARRAGMLLMREWIRVPLFGFLYAMWLIGAGVTAWQGNWGTTALVLAGGLAVTGLIYAAIYLVLQDFAQHAVMVEHEQRLRDAGWDGFWSDKELMRLTPH